jgi:tetratricopeptide (TPR) repeat protein
MPRSHRIAFAIKGFPSMLSTLIALAVGVLFGLALHFTTSLHPVVPLIAGMVVFTAIYVIVLKKIMARINQAMEAVQKDIAANRPEAAIHKLEAVQKKYANWQFYIQKQMNSQIGMVYYLRRDFSKAYDYLTRGFVRHWVAMAMLAIIYMKRNQPKKMVATFEKTVTANRKEPLLWTLYAYCLEKVGDRNKAVTVMEKGLKKVRGNALMEANLDALKSGKKMKMQEYGDLWYQFQLEKQGAIIRKHTKAMQGRRKIVRR